MDLHNVTLSGEERRIYTLGEDKEIKCYVQPDSVTRLSYIHFEWYLSGKESRNHSRVLNSKDFQPGPQIAKCAEPAYSTTELDWEFFIIDKKKPALFLNPGATDCIWAEPWMNEFVFLQPEISSEITTKNSRKFLKYVCKFDKPGLSVMTTKSVDLLRMLTNERRKV